LRICGTTALEASQNAAYVHAHQLIPLGAGISQNGRILSVEKIAALFTRMSMRPNCSTVAAASWLQLASSATSVRTKRPFHLGRDGLALVRVELRHHHLPRFAREAMRIGPAQALAGAGDDRDLVLSLIARRSSPAASPGAAVEAHDVVVEDRLLGFVAELLVVHELLDLVLRALDVGLVREVRGEQHRLVADALERVGQGDLAALAVEVDAAGADVFASAASSATARNSCTCLARPDFVRAIQPVHDVGHPAGARLEVRDAQPREALEHALITMLVRLDDLRERVLERVRLREAVERS